jgi:hypothetical protein
MPQPSTESNFRSNLSQFRWAQGVTDDSQPAQSASQPSNPFSRFYNSIAGDYVPLRSNERSNEEEAWFALSRWERCVDFLDHFCLIPTHDTCLHGRLLGFIVCLLGAAVCFFVAFLTLPLLALRPAKFALAFRCAHLFAVFKAVD